MGACAHNYRHQAMIKQKLSKFRAFCHPPSVLHTVLEVLQTMVENDILGICFIPTNQKISGMDVKEKAQLPYSGDLLYGGVL